MLVGRISWLRSNLSQPQTTVWILEKTHFITNFRSSGIPWHPELWYNLGACCDTLSVFHNVDPNPTYTILLQGLSEPWDLQATGHGHQYVLQHGERFPAVSTEVLEPGEHRWHVGYSLQFRQNICWVSFIQIIWMIDQNSILLSHWLNPKIPYFHLAGFRI